MAAACPGPRAAAVPGRSVQPTQGNRPRPRGRRGSRRQEPGACRQEALVSSRNGAASREARLRLLESVVASANDSMVITQGEPLDEPGPIIEWVNPAFARMTGYTAEEAIGKNPRLLQGPETDPETKRRIRAALARGEPVRVENLNYRKD